MTVLIFSLEIPLPKKDGLYIETGPWTFESDHGAAVPTLQYSFLLGLVENACFCVLFCIYY